MDTPSLRSCIGPAAARPCRRACSDQPEHDDVDTRGKFGSAAMQEQPWRSCIGMTVMMTVLRFLLEDGDDSNVDFNGMTCGGSENLQSDGNKGMSKFSMAQKR